MKKYASNPQVFAVMSSILQQIKRDNQAKIKTQEMTMCLRGRPQPAVLFECFRPPQHPASPPLHCILQSSNETLGAAETRAYHRMAAG